MNGFSIIRKDARLVMLLSLAVAILFALGHGIFYRCLHNRDVGIIDQRLSTSIGTAFAFLVKASLGTAIATAYAQLLWRTLLSRAHTVEMIDSLTSLLGSVLELRLDYPLLIALAVIFWTIPIVAIFPPGALSVFTTYRADVREGSANMIDYNTTSLLAVNQTAVLQYPKPDTDPVWHLTTKLSLAASSLASYVAGQGEVPTVHGVVNSTYLLSFGAPNLQCNTKYWPVDYVLSCPLNNDPAHPAVVNVTYLSWYSSSVSPSYYGLGNTSFSANVTSNDSGHHNYTTNDICGNIMPKVSNPGFTGNATMLYIATTFKDQTGWNITTCGLHNVTTTLAVNLTSSDDQLYATMQNYSLQPIDRSWADWTLNTTGASMQIWDSTNVHSEASRYLYNQLATFYAVFKWFGDMASGTNVVSSRPAIFDTRIIGAEELHGSSASTDHGGVFGDPGSGLLAPMLEQLFQNITLTLTTSPLLVGSIQTPMNVTSPYNVYHYHPRHLEIPYAVAVVVTAGVVLLGWFTITKNGAAYTTKFSTFVRTLQSKSGADPLPVGIGLAEIRLGAHGGEEELVTYERPLLKDGS
ncbi:hypothetical protein BAUCODRAFT_23420 [Baudoinia panamericana UAMH 10762]|uniref:Transmembrane protein n=1 Tax=Baudoinia panamericana (strain UAMH 10762) TaxID=717646 RepID=M2MZI9_BAUPA|nr:uncharacterized protein BAUCODRAFT_23420 [Baudoinia panamericana UAMH 10762]EMC97018.1 hypothetical protein BAUCODRAFT_23420 [Baudoinia panamericana UAMH 10762]